MVAMKEAKEKMLERMNHIIHTIAFSRMDS